MYSKKFLQVIKNPNAFEERLILDKINRYHPEELNAFVVRNKSNQDYLNKVKERLMWK